MSLRRQHWILALELLALAPVMASAGSAHAAATALGVRPARPADDSSHGESRWAEEWQVLAFEPAGRGFASITFVAGPIPRIAVEAHAGSEKVAAGVMLPYGLVPHRGPGVTIVNRPDDAPQQASSISYTGGRYVVDLTTPVRGHLTITVQRPGVTVGPWRLGREPIVKGGPPTYVPGSMRWSVPVAVGTASGWLENDGHRITLDNWRAYHDHTWGHFRRASSSWTHWDFAVATAQGEAWILNGLEPTDGRYHALPNDRRWQGVLIHATRSRVDTCQARITRHGWEAMHLSWDYWLPSSVRARCGTTTLTVQPAWKPWRLGGLSDAILGNSPLAGGNGWIEHAVPPVPTS